MNARGSPHNARRTTPARRGVRLIAYVVDWLVTVIIASVLVTIGGLQLYLASDRGRQDASDRSIYIFILIVAAIVPVWLVITLVGWSTAGRSVGKLAAGLRIVNRHGCGPGPLRGVVRLVVYAVETVPLPASVVVLWMWSVAANELPVWTLPATGLALIASLASLSPALLHRGGRPLHDLAAGTFVVEDE